MTVSACISSANDTEECSFEEQAAKNKKITDTAIMVSKWIFFIVYSYKNNKIGCKYKISLNYSQAKVLQSQVFEETYT
jgi:hypothetical protein